MSKGECLTRVFIWGTLVGYFVGVVLLLVSRKRSKLTSIARWAWTIACACLCLHVICAYHFYHRWSQDSAYRETARQTANVVGIEWGGGLYFNYALIAGWLLDVVWWWRSLDLYRRRSAVLTAIWQGFVLFMIFNATVVFKAGSLRIIGVIMTLVLCSLWLYTSTPAFESRL